MRQVLTQIGLAAALVAAGSAHAGTQVATNLLGGPQSILGSTTVSLSGSGALGTKIINSIEAVGIQGGSSGNEIDIGESLTATFSSGVVVSNLQLAFLYDGPEYNDGNELAKVTATVEGGGTLVSTLQAIGTSTASPSMGSVVNLQPADNVAAALWSWSNPFGNAKVTSLTFTSLSVPNTGSDTDYSLYSISAVPEPETYALMLGGLAALGFAARRRLPR